MASPAVRPAHAAGSYTEIGMRALIPSVRRAFWGAFVSAILLAPGVGAAAPPDAADLDGDGRSDVITLDRTQPSTVRVWLTRTSTAAVIHTRRPIVRIIAADLDGDRRPELIVRDIFSALHIWKQDPRSGFAPHAPKHKRQTAQRPDRHTLDGGMPDATETLPGFRFGSDLLVPPVLSAIPAVSDASSRRSVLPRAAPAPALAPSFARPPPALLA